MNVIDVRQKSLEELVEDAVAGDAKALRAVVEAIKDDIYGLAIRILWHPADAEDATQEILVRICTSLKTFEGRSAFRTWVYRVAVHALLNIKRGRVEPPSLSFDAFRADLLDGLIQDATARTPEEQLLEHEVRIGCTQAMLLCLDREHRLAYVLGEIMGLSGREAASCLDIPPATYRKRFSRARQRVTAFMQSTCGLVSDRAPCRCAGRITPAQQKGRLDPRALLFAKHPTTAAPEDIAGVMTTICELRSAAEIMRANPAYRAPEHLPHQLVQLLRAPTHASPHPQNGSPHA